MQIRNCLGNAETMEPVYIGATWICNGVCRMWQTIDLHKICHTLHGVTGVIDMDSGPLVGWYIFFPSWLATWPEPATLRNLQLCYGFVELWLDDCSSIPCLYFDWVGFRIQISYLIQFSSLSLVSWDPMFFQVDVCFYVDQLKIGLFHIPLHWV